MFQRGCIHLRWALYIYQASPTSPHVVRESFKKNYPHSSQKNSSIFSYQTRLELQMSLASMVRWNWKRAFWQQTNQMSLVQTGILPWLSLSSDLNPTENEWGELKRSTKMELLIWRIWRDSVWRNRFLISYQVFSKLFSHNRRKLRAVTLGKGCCNNWVPIMWPTWTR